MSLQQVGSLKRLAGLIMVRRVSIWGCFMRREMVSERMISKPEFRMLRRASRGTVPDVPNWDDSILRAKVSKKILPEPTDTFKKVTHWEAVQL